MRIITECPGGNSPWSRRRARRGLCGGGPCTTLRLRRSGKKPHADTARARQAHRRRHHPQPVRLSIAVGPVHASLHAISRQRAHQPYSNSAFDCRDDNTKFWNQCSCRRLRRTHGGAVANTTRAKLIVQPLFRGRGVAAELPPAQADTGRRDGPSAGRPLAGQRRCRRSARQRATAHTSTSPTSDQVTAWSSASRIKPSCANCCCVRRRAPVIVGTNA